MSEVDDALRRLRGRLALAFVRAVDKGMKEKGYTKGIEVHDVATETLHVPYKKRVFKPVDQIELTLVLDPPEDKK